MSIRVFIYEDNNAHRDSLKALLQLSPELEWVGDAPDCSHVLDDIEKYYPDVVLMDINMPLVNGLEGLRQIKSTYPSVKVLMQTAFEDTEKIFTSLRNGANGYILKKDSVARLCQAIQEVYEGGAAINPGIASKVLEYFKPQPPENNLSQRENDVLALLADGMSYKMVADKLYISYSTVNSHVKNIYIKLHISSLGEAIAYYYQHIKQH
jgi:DNA-binding NarL/FixJ family response regulator